MTTEQRGTTAHRAPDLIFDIGMRNGEDAAFYLAKGFRVVSFEADPDLAEQARHRFRSELAEGRFHLMEGATVPPSLSGGGDRVRFFRNTTHTEWGTIFADWAERNQTAGHPSTAVDVRVVDFAACLAKYGIPHYMKIDIEGADLGCLEALAGFPARPAYVSIESEKTSFGRLREEFALLSALGYDAFQTVQQGRVHRQRPPVPAAEGVHRDWSFPYGSSGLFGAELPGRWCGLGAAIRRYRMIFVGYKLIGDQSPFGRHRPARRFLKRLSARLERLGLPVPQPVPGWYDTHARHRGIRPHG